MNPVFVYGTLRPQGALASTWHGLAQPACDGYVTLPGLGLVTLGGFPYALPRGYPLDGPDSRLESVVGGFLVPHDEEALLNVLDRVEGVPHHFVREALLAQVQGPLMAESLVIECWVYTASQTTRQMLDAQGAWPVTNNDWYQYQQQQV